MKVLDHLNFVGKINSRYVQYVEKFMVGWLVLQSKYSVNLDRCTLVNRLQHFFLMWVICGKLVFIGTGNCACSVTLVQSWSVPCLALQSRVDIILYCFLVISTFYRSVCRLGFICKVWYFGSLQPIATYLRLYRGILNKLQGKAVTHSEKIEWWIILMVDCVTILLVEIEQNVYTIHH